MKFNIYFKSNKKQIHFEQGLHRHFKVAEIRLVHFLKFFKTVDALVNEIK